MENNQNMSMVGSSSKTGIIVALFIGLILGLVIGNLPKLQNNQKAEVISSTDVSTISGEVIVATSTGGKPATITTNTAHILSQDLVNGIANILGTKMQASNVRQMEQVTTYLAQGISSGSNNTIGQIAPITCTTVLHCNSPGTSSVSNYYHTECSDGSGWFTPVDGTCSNAMPAGGGLGTSGTK